MFMPPDQIDFFTKYAAITAIVGFGLFNAFGFSAIALYPFPFSLLHDPYSAVGAVLTGNYAAGVLSSGLALAGSLWIPIVLVFLREIIAGGKAKAQPFALAGFVMQLVGRVGVILVGTFPTQPWRGTHDAVAIVWMAGELLGVIFIMVEMFRSPAERKWGLSAVLAIVVGSLSWLPYAFGAWDGMGVSEFVTMSAVYAYSVALWVRAYKGNAAIAH
jgi:hypothetical membrane protein